MPTPSPAFIPMYNITEVLSQDIDELKRQVQLNFEDIMAILSGGLSTISSPASEEAMAWSFFMDGEG